MSITESDIRSQATATTFGSRRLTSVLHPVSISFALIGILVTLFASASLYRSEQKRTETIVLGKESLIEERIHHQKLAGIHLTRAASALVEASVSVTEKEWEAFCATLYKSSEQLGILGIGFFENSTLDKVDAGFDIPRFGKFSHLSYRPTHHGPAHSIGFPNLVGIAQAEAMSSAFREADSALSGEVTLPMKDGSEQSAAFVFHPVFKGEFSSDSDSAKSDALLGFVFCALKLDDPTTVNSAQEGTAATAAAPASKILSEILSTPSEDLRFDLRKTQNRSDSLQLLPLLIASAGIAFTLVGLLFLSDSRLTQERATKIAIDMAESLERREKEVIQLNEELEDKVKSRTAQLQSVNQDLEAFSYTLSHDLRTPVRHIDHLTSCLREDCEMTPEVEANDFLARIRRSTERMDQMITDILTLAGHANTPPRLRDIDLTAITREMLEMLLETVPERKRIIQIQEGMTGKADPTMIRVVIQNLLENALKFSASKEPPEIRCGSIPLDSGAVYFVSDNGSGLKMKHAEKVYLPFKRLHREKEIAGSGIGMSTVKKIITHHEGTILCQSEVGVGTTFYFTLSRQKDIDLEELASVVATLEVQPVVVRCSESENPGPLAHHSLLSENDSRPTSTATSPDRVPARP